MDTAHSPPPKRLNDLREGWDRFWFTPTDPATLAVLRVATGAMLFYTHLVWSIDLLGFFGPNGRLPAEFGPVFRDSHWLWSHLHAIQSPALLWTVHGGALVILAMFALGLFTRVTSVLAWLITISYAHRATGALFGLDQINTFLAMYLMLGPSGACYSIDCWRKKRANRDGKAPLPQALPLWRRIVAPATDAPSTSANVAIRLVQIHMCIVYLFAGLGKLLGETWWSGDAMWIAFANYEYQTFDMTWLASHPMVINFLTHLTIAWEVSYIALVWPRLTRPWIVLASVPLHLGIAVCMGMITFGLIMIVGNAAFLAPSWVRAAEARLIRRSGAG